ncbi:MAG: hypothetical protein C4525_16395 [Desulfarculus sp.]|nr:MAG: hypothetical protein C4525_16395 [Desulfarculus sp.]
MKKALLLMASLALLLTATAAWADSFLVLGRAPMTGSEAEVRQKAVADALYRGVSQRACTLVDPATLRKNLEVLDKQVLADAKKFITNYSLVASATSGTSYLALVSLTVDEKSLAKALIQAALRLPTGHLGSMLVMVSEEAAPGRPPVYWWSGLPGAPEAPAPVSKVLKALGIKTVNVEPLKALLTPHLRQPVLNEANALELGRQTQAKVVILGSVRTYPLVTPEHVAPPPLVQLIALETTGGRPVAMVETDGPAYHSTPPPDARQVVTAAVEASVRDLMAKVAASDAAGLSAQSEIMINLSGVRSLAQLYRFEQVLGSLSEAVTKVTREAVGPGQAKLKVKIVVPASYLADQLLVQNYGDFLVNVVETSARHMDVVLIPKDQAMNPAPQAPSAGASMAPARTSPAPAPASPPGGTTMPPRPPANQ